MLYRYLAWKEKGWWQGQKLLSPAQVNTLTRHLAPDHEIFATIQHYNNAEEIVACPIYADFDHKDQSLEKTKADVQAFVFRIMGELNVTPRIYFSGTKGFHVVVPYPLAHQECHYLARSIARHFGGDLPSLDYAVYRPRAMFRLPGSLASTPGRRKVQITRDELFSLSMSDIIRISEVAPERLIEECDLSMLSEGTMDHLVKDGLRALQTYSVVPTEARLTPMLTPCLKHFLKRGVAEGQRNKALFILAKFFKASDVPQKEAERILLHQEHIRQGHESREADVSGVLRSVYRSTRETRMGCRKGSDAELMQEYCSAMCPFNPEFPKLHFKKV